MECTEIRGRLSEFIDGFMDTETEVHVRKHLDSCKACAEELASLKALVKGLGDLDPVEAPADFLARLHERMERPTGFSKVFRALFRPFRIKLPLEFAGAAAAALLVFIVLNVQQPKEESRYRPMPEKQAEIARKVAPMTAPRQDRSSPPKGENLALSPAPAAPEPRAVLKAETPLPTVEGLEEDTAEGKPAAVELALVIRTDRSRPETRAPSAPSEALESPPAEVKMKKGVTVAGRARPKAIGEIPHAADKEIEAPVDSDRAAPAYKDQPLPSLESPVALFPRVRGLVTHHGGKVLSVEYEQGTQSPRSILIDLPADRIGSFSEGLKTLGFLKTPPPIPSEDTAEMIQVRIRFLYP